MARPARLLVVLGVLGAIGFGIDRLTAHIAADRIAAAVQTDARLAHRPHVTVNGFPFLTQAVRGRYDHIAVRAADLFERGTSDGTVLRLDLAGVRVSASKAWSGVVHRIPIDHVMGTVEMPFADLQAESHVPGLSVTSAEPGHPDELRLVEVASVAGLEISAQLTARVTVEGRSVVVTAHDVKVAGGGPPLTAGVSASLLSRAAFSVRLPGLPTGVDMSGVTVSPTGVSVTVGASGLVLTR